VRSLRSFLLLYDPRSRQALRIAVSLAVAVSVADFVALSVLYPVFGTILGGDDQSMPVAIPLGPTALVVLAVVMLALRSVGAFWVRYWWGLRAARAEVELGTRVLAAYAFARYEFHLTSNSTELMSRSVAHVNMATASGLVGLVAIAADASSALAMTLALWVASPVAALVITGVLVIVGGILVAVSSGYIRQRSTELATRISTVYTQVANLLRGIRELTVANGRSAALRSVESARMEMAATQRKVLILNEVPRLLLDLVLYGGILVALVWTLGASDPAGVLPLVALYVVAGLRIVPGVGRVLGAMTQVRSGMEVGILLEHELAGLGRGPVAEVQPEPLPRGDLEIRGLVFAYGDDDPVLRGVDLCVAAGEMVGLVGPSGGGKTTLLSIVLGLLPPGAGRITYGSEPVQQADPHWFATVAYVPQDVYVLDDTVVANVAMGDPVPDPDRVCTALARAKLLDVVQTLPDGPQTRLREGGARLSAGQRQRLGIARALYRDAKVLLLDEPTASLDNETEGQVVETLLNLKGEVTLIVVAHRLSTIERADRVLRLSDGRLVDA